MTLFQPLTRHRALCLATAALAVLVPQAAAAQRMAPALWGNPEPRNPDPDAPVRKSAVPVAGDTVDFEADQLMYDETARMVTAQGRVRVSRDGYALVADRVEYRRGAEGDPGEVVAIGNNVRAAEVGDQVLFSPEDRYEVEVGGSDYIMLRERDLHAVAATRIESNTGLYL